MMFSLVSGNNFSDIYHSRLLSGGAWVFRQSMRWEYNHQGGINGHKEEAYKAHNSCLILRDKYVSILVLIPKKLSRFDVRAPEKYLYGLLYNPDQSKL